MLHATAADESTSGFTLIEVLVALAIVALSLTSIGGLIATTVRGTKSIERHFTQLETARAIAAALPDRDQLVVGTLSGDTAGQHWRVDILPLPRSKDPGLPRWAPLVVAVTVWSPSGGMLRIDTVRLRRTVP